MKQGDSKFIAAQGRRSTAIVSSEKPVWRDPDCGQPVLLLNPAIAPYGFAFPSRNERRQQRKARKKGNGHAAN
jgi:hypothetical protein